ncbi:hypothetical protein ACFQ5J_01495 [Lacticaseibacillus baoqingensis]|uniref:Acid-resistance membrane protein n=1 Tax=Lacticaseibacillus baoqingensis TaxID=2486013 RepID=A0ABW4E4K6_9LACO|nr:hypothetical protein [Lacticaseibacillus baoqingensis]
MSHAKKGHAYGLFFLLLLAAILFGAIGWFVIHPQTVLAMATTVSLGVGLAVGIWLLIGLDASCQTKRGRFLVDLIIGGAMMALIYVFMLGIVFDGIFTFGAIGIVVVLALLFSLRQI